MKVVVIGGVAAGPSFATRLRRLNEQAEIIMLERGEHISYASCALPYYLGGVIIDRDSLIERTPEILKQKNNLDVRIHSEVTAIDAQTQTVQVHDLATDRTYSESYDKLILATGASPVLPAIPGLATAEAAFTIRSMGDADKIKAYMDAHTPQSVTLLGAGAAGVELAENFRHRGWAVTLIDQAAHVMAPYDPEMAAFLETEITSHGVDLRLSTTVEAVSDNGHTLRLSDNTMVTTDLLIVVTGVAPNNTLAQKAGITLANDGHIPVDEHLQTDLPNIYAIGDIIETTSRITGRRVPSVLSSAANRQGHLLADIINGEDLTYPGFIGVAVAKVFDLTASTVGYTETALQNAGITNYDSVMITPFDHAFFYPNARRLNLKILFEKGTGKLLGGQFIGYEGVDKRSGEFAVAVAAKMTVNDLPDLEFPYSPPFSSSRDILNVAGYVAINRMTQLASTVAYHDLDADARAHGYFLDIREPGRPVSGNITASGNIPLSQLRDRLAELPQDQPIYIIERKGLGPYNAIRILAGHGLAVKIVTE
ncbi:MAG: FAD-dependent oxidoreductase [Lactobacillus sp.]|jgi:NADPH-dependent 2,4-dienoyl-CoA reductase/sulfur reductase-like enzyme/rhodanese-related sulfurtransferase|nr:FAD-dependent oxidoreductase [Lactobacillus sp.]MCI2032038.1 FAD-dependent oxidoreductase [Lactobacillus sp.]